MSLSYDQISAITDKKFIPKMVDNIFDTDALLARAKKSFTVKLDGGEKIVQPLNYAQTTASGWYSGTESLDVTDNDNITAAEYTWKQLYASISVSGRDEMVNSGDAAILNLVKSKVQIAEKTIADKLGLGLYSDGSDSKSIVGLADIAATDQTVGGISQTSYSWWRGVVDSTSANLSMAKLQTLWTNLCINNEHPSVVLATRTLYNAYYALLTPNQRYMDDETAKGGFQNLMFNGAPFIVSTNASSGNLFMLNEKYLHLYTHKERDFKFEAFQKPIGQDVKVAKIYWMGAFGSSNNRMQGRMTAATAA